MRGAVPTPCLCQHHSLNHIGLTPTVENVGFGAQIALHFPLSVHVMCQLALHSCETRLQMFEDFHRPLR